MGERVTIPRQGSFPAVCCCCFARASASIPVKGRRTTSLVVASLVQEITLDLPVCAECLGHMSFPGYGLIGCLSILILVGGAGVGGLLGAILAGPVLRLGRGPAEDAVMYGFALVLPLAVTVFFLWRSLGGRPKSAPDQTHVRGTPVEVVTFDDQTITLEVANAAFAGALRAPATAG